MKTSFDYFLPPTMIAQFPLKEREKARLLSVERAASCIREGVFTEIIDYFNAGDALVLNDTRVIPARLRGIKDTGGKVEIFLLKKRGFSLWEALLRGNIREGQLCHIESPKNQQERIEARIVARTKKGTYIVEFQNKSDEEVFGFGEVPLPPYIKRRPISEDADYYQTVYAAREGAVAAPTAGLHFTESILDKIQKKGVRIFRVTLHIGWASFKIIRMEEEIVGEEYMEITAETADGINAVRKEGGKVFAVGTSVVRALESAVEEGQIIPATGPTELFIKNGFVFRVVDGLITNFHLPGSTHLYLVCAFAGVDLMEKAYNMAVNERYRFYSYGDAMLII